MSDEAPVRKKGMSTGVKVLLGLLIGGGLLTVVCCGVVGFMAARMFQPLTDPAAIVAVSDEIASVDLPDGFEPAGGVKVDFFSMFQMKMAVHERKVGETKAGTVLLMEMVVPGNLSGEEMQAQFEKQKNEQGGGEQKIEVKESVVRKVTIDGQEREFTFITGTAPGSDKAVRQVQGIFPGRKGMAFFQYNTDEEHWNEEEAVKMVESLSTK